MRKNAIGSRCLACYAAPKSNHLRRPFARKNTDAVRLRCDRALPACSNCRCRPEVLFCDYASASGYSWGSTDSSNATVYQDGKRNTTKDNTGNATQSASVQALQSKVEQLERMIQLLTTARPTTPSPAMSISEDAPVRHEACLTDGTQVEPATARPVAMPVPISSLASSSPATTSVTGEALWATLMSEVQSSLSR